MFVSHFTGWSKEEIMDMPCSEVQYWYVEAVKMHNKLNAPPKGSDE